MEIIFSRPEYLWGLLILPVLIILYFASVRLSKNAALKFANFVALSRVSGGLGEVSSMNVLIVRSFALICIILSISGMTVWYVGETSTKDYVLAIDASASMLQDDFYPSRLESTKLAAINFVDSLPLRSSVAVVSFAGTSFVERPLTSDRSLVKEVIQNLSVKSVGGTDLGDAIISSTNLLINSDKSRVVVLITDGRSNIGVSEQTGILYAINNHVSINTVGVGVESTEDFNLGVDVESLEDIANLTLGDFYLAENEEDLSNIYTQMATNPSEGKISFNLSFLLLGIALILLILDWVLGGTIYRRIP